MIEIGTTNKTHIKDYINAINENTGMIMIAHTSNYKVIGFAESVEINDIVKIAKKKRVPVFLDLGSGAIIDYEKFGLPKENLVQKYIKMHSCIVWELGVQSPNMSIFLYINLSLLIRFLVKIY